MREAEPDAAPLAGAGILVTRPARQAAGFAARIAAIGGSPVVFPAIVILPPDDAAPLQRAHDALESYDHVVFVSANAVEFGMPDPARWPPHVLAFVPGPGTAAALHDLGLAAAQVRVPWERQDSEGLLALPEFAAPRGKRVLVLRGDGGRDFLAATLRSRGASVDQVTCYRRERPGDARGLDAAFAEDRITAVTITSGEGLDNLWALVTDATRARWRCVPTFAPHERIFARARALGLDARLTGPGDAGLIAGLLEWASRRS